MKHSISLLKKNEFTNIYKIMEEAFPKAEIRSYHKSLSLLDHSKYRIFTIKNCKDNINAFIADWQFKHFRFVEHFAVAKNSRGLGLGSKTMKKYLALEDKPVFLEVEDLKTVEAKRRISFYENLGFILNDFGYIQPPLQKTDKKIPLSIMSYPKPISKKQFPQIKEKVFSSVYNL